MRNIKNHLKTPAPNAFVQGLVDAKIKNNLLTVKLAQISPFAFIGAAALGMGLPFLATTGLALAAGAAAVWASNNALVAMGYNNKKSFPSKALRNSRGLGLALGMGLPACIGVTTAHTTFHSCQALGESITQEVLRFEKGLMNLRGSLSSDFSTLASATTIKPLSISNPPASHKHEVKFAL